MGSKKIDFVIPEHLAELWPHFVEMRKLKKRPITEFAQKNVIAKLERLAPGNPEIQAAILTQTIEHSWDSVYNLHEDYQEQRPQMTNFLAGGMTR